LKRIPVGYREFLRDVVSTFPLTWDEQALLERALRDGRSPDIERAGRRLIDALLRRQVLELLDREPDGSAERLHLRDPQRRFAIRIRLPLATTDPEFSSIPLPLDPATRTGFDYHQVRDLLAIQGNLVSYNRVMTPRELVQRMEHTLRDIVPVTQAVFHPLEIPAEEDWPSPPLDEILRPRTDELHALARHRDSMLHCPDLGASGSRLILGMGDDGTGWRGILSLDHPQREHFTTERLSLAQLVAQHFQGLLSTSIQLQSLIFYDFLTGVYNRSYFEEQLDRELAVADRHGQSMALLIVDIDDFKGFNTRYGYKAGDRVLATVACVLKATLRHTDTLARYGGEEFVAILAPPVPRDEARVIAERLRLAVEDEPFSLHGLDGTPVSERVTVSVGGVLYPEGGRSGRDLWNSANRLILEAKARGKNQVRFAGDPAS